jgi:hypothetical protein
MEPGKPFWYHMVGKILDYKVESSQSISFIE